MEVKWDAPNSVIIDHQKHFWFYQKLNQNNYNCSFDLHSQKNSNVVVGHLMHQVPNSYILLTLDLLCVGISCKSFGLSYFPSTSYQFALYMIHYCLWQFILKFNKLWTCN